MTTSAAAATLLPTAAQIQARLTELAVTRDAIHRDCEQRRKEALAEVEAEEVRLHRTLLIVNSDTKVGLTGTASQVAQDVAAETAGGTVDKSAAAEAAAATEDITDGAESPATE